MLWLLVASALGGEGSLASAKQTERTLALATSALARAQRSPSPDRFGEIPPWVDLAAPHGTPVFATADGLVGMAQWYSSYGNYVQIEHGGSLQTRYAHLSSYTVQPGDMVQKGDLIGYVGSTGRSTGPHLHYEVRVEGQPVNPVPYMLADAVPVADATAGQGGPE